MKAITYIRVSTQKQGVSGLGLEAQQFAVKQFNRGDYNIIHEYVEVESGKNANRPQLMAALAHCKREKAILIIAKLDRLSRDVHFITGLMKAGVEFRCCDMPEANKMIIQMMAVFAEWERDRISERTKAALQVAKNRGVKLGSPDIANLAKINRAAALERYRDETPIIMSLQAQGKGVRAIARQLGLCPMKVSRIIKRNQ